MARTTGFVLLALVAVSCIASAYAATAAGACHKLTAVSASNKKRTVNFDELTSMSTATPFQAVDAAGGWTYQFAICANTVSCGGTQAAACQETQQVPPELHSLGTYPNPPAAVYSTAYSKGAIVFTLPPSGDRGSIITVICDPKASKPSNFSVISAPAGQLPYIYQLFMSHKSACGTGGLSVGWVLFIILVVLTVVYFVGGFLVLKFAMKRESMSECIPQYEFWADLPSLCKDGLMFVVNKIRGGPSSYETVA